MRLADLVMAAQGGVVDQEFAGMVTSVARALAKAERFELGEDVAEACRHVAHSKPSSILSALPMIRLPYSTVWAEWPMHPDAPDADPQCPVRIGCLYEAHTGMLDAGFMTWVWTHSLDDHALLSVCPIGVHFNFKLDADLPEEARTLAAMLEVLPAEKKAEIDRHAPTADGFIDNVTKTMRLTADQYQPPAETMRKMMAEADSRWRRSAGDDEELRAAMQLANHAMYMVTLHCVNFVFAAAEAGLTQRSEWDKAIAGWHNDLKGEFPFAQAFLCLLNARHGLAREREDLSRLNKRREAGGKTPLCEFTVTQLDLSRGRAARGIGTGMSREAMRRHLVRGHFKVRSSGIFWWSPFVRGHGEAVTRARYEVRTNDHTG